MGDGEKITPNSALVQPFATRATLLSKITVRWTSVLKRFGGAQEWLLEMRFCLRRRVWPAHAQLMP
jgi:hypothetical protein